MKAKWHVILAAMSPIALGILAGLTIFLTKVPALPLPRLEFLLDTIISCSSTISGFILASVTILVGATSSEIMKKIRKHGALTELRWRYTEALILGLVVLFYIFRRNYRRFKQYKYCVPLTQCRSARLLYL